ncbi:hypothetical protein FDK21_11900 [Cohaesibacter sp. CAU 1516]|uniref:SIR2 family protein n=1 Tax=Cohaesibacter sp. CAU 1516 TaxID=2576038 RepID=UPI0010FD5E74|nr:SIR2 family protein [Cohaesibacter sp. CAU 1516]TLP45459.1 hypothetical protein FDK21_11900 [Cohaesibacter sp. CAU 1516]
MKKVFVFGNGLGMALAPNYFVLDKALREVWDDEGFLQKKEKALIEACLPAANEIRRPTNEDDLDLLQRVLAACDTLKSIQPRENYHWLTDDGREFPRAIRMFVHRVACYFHTDNYSLPKKFIEPLVGYVKENKPHVATLNYDQLLYDPFVEEEVLKGYCGALVDGVIGRGFDPENLDQKYGRDFGLYMHLHGSPLYYNEGPVIKKRERGEFDGGANESTHIVLTHVKHKSSIISSSPILSEYWVRLEDAFKECDEVTLFGYSGNDDHLNLRLAKVKKVTKLRIVEWEGAEGNRNQYWSDKIHDEAEIIRLKNILDFTDW